MKCTRVSCAALLVCLAGSAAAQTTPAPAPALPQIDFSALVDGYFSFNSNHPASGFNTLRNFEVRANQFSLNMTKFSVSHAAEHGTAQ